MGLLNVLQAASNTAADTVAAPVDGIAWILRKLGVPVEAPVGGSDWMRRQGLTREVAPGMERAAGETLGLLSPMVAAAKAPQIASGLLKMGENAAAPGTISRGMARGQRGVFGGELAKTADKAALDKAKKMADAGADQRAIWSETGWFKGGDGKWRFEIDDSASTLKAANPKAVDWLSAPGPAEYPVGAIDDVLSHPALGAAYPDVPGIRATIKKGAGGGGSYTPNTGFGERIQANAMFSGNAYKEPAETRGALLHELQHAIQKREGMATGGGFDAEGADIYRRLAGEAEARAVQARMNLTPAQRRALFPLDSYDVPLDQLIYR